MHVDGGGGTGKSYLIKVLSSHLQQSVPPGTPSPIWRAAPTGVASNQISGTTLHSLLHLPVDTQFSPLSPTNIGGLQRKLQGVQYLVIDEKSMLGLRQLGWIDHRLRQIFPHRQEDFFGGMSLIIVGDFFQLPPVAQKPLYYDKQLQDLMDISGRRAYQQFSQTVFLSTVQRQQGDDQAGFRNALGEVRLMKLSCESWELLCTRLQSKLTRHEVDSFRSALRIYNLRAQVESYNHDHLVAILQPVIQVTAVNHGAGAQEVAADKAGNLLNKIPICIGARVMLTRNLWQPCGLVNGAQGYIFDLGWAPGADWQRDPPCIIMVIFDKYTGPAFITTDDGRKVIPILPVKTEFVKGSETCSRTQFPLHISYAITVYKSQSITIDQAVINLSERDFQSGLSYVALSRIKTLEGLMLDAPFDRGNLYTEKATPGMQIKLQDEERRRKQVLEEAAFAPLGSQL